MKMIPTDLVLSLVGFAVTLATFYSSLKKNSIEQEKRIVSLEKEVEGFEEFKIEAKKRLDNHDQQNKSILILAEQVKSLSNDIKELKSDIKKIK